MAQLGADAITLVDLTDGVSVVLSSESYQFPGTTTNAIAGSTSTKIQALMGGDYVAASVNQAAIVSPAGVTVTSDGHATSPTLTISVTTSVTAGGIVSIPVVVDGLTIQKDFSFSIAFKGSNGANGAAAVALEISSSQGLVFKNTQVATILTARVYQGGVEVTGGALTALGTVKWYKDGTYMAGKDGLTLTITAGDVADRATYEAKLEY